MYSKILTRLSIVSTINITMITETTGAGMFDWMTPNKWFNNNNRDYDRDYYRGYNYGYPGYGYGYPGYGYPGWGGYPGVAYPNWGYPTYTYPIIQPQQNSNTTPAAPPTPQ